MNILSPFQVNIELSTVCNYSCKHCAVSLPSYKGIVMNRENAFKIIDELSLMNYPPIVIGLSGHGESTILPWFEDLIIYIRKKISKVNIGFNTNGSNLGRIGKTIIMQKVDHITISVDGGTEETFDEIRGKGNFNRLMDNLSIFNEYKTNLKSTIPYICFAITLTNKSIFELEKIVNIAHTFNVKHIVTQPLTPYIDLNTEDFTLNKMTEQEKIVAYSSFCSARDLSKKLNIKFNSLNDDIFDEPKITWNEKNSSISKIESIPQTENDEKNYRLCLDQWNIMFIKPDGRFNTCCYRDSDISETMESHSLIDIWYNSYGLNQIRHNLITGNLDKVCKNCVVRSASDIPPKPPNNKVKRMLLYNFGHLIRQIKNKIARE
ncbi:MAG: radical SAM protein [Desulfobacterales bacterium]|nr:radical SAM protein [Desulfobacterales bacterium]